MLSPLDAGSRSQGCAGSGLAGLLGPLRGQFSHALGLAGLLGPLRGQFSRTLRLAGLLGPLRGQFSHAAAVCSFWPHTCEDRVELSCLCTADLCGQCRACVLMSCTRISPTIRPATRLASLAWKAF